MKLTHLKFSILIAFIAVMFFSGGLFTIDKAKISGFFSAVPMGYSAAIFLLLYVASDFINWVLKDALKIVGAVLFGAYLSTLLIYISEIINAFIFFRMSGYLGSGFLQAQLKGAPKKFYDNLGRLSFGWILALRAVPLIPFRIMDMGFGLSGVPLRRYMAAVVIASPLRIFWIQFILAAIPEGFSIEAISRYLAKNPFITYTTSAYLVVACCLALILRKKLQ